MPAIYNPPLLQIIMSTLESRRKTNGCFGTRVTNMRNALSKCQLALLHYILQKINYILSHTVMPILDKKIDYLDL